MKIIPIAIEVVAIALIDRQGRVLMQRRPADKAHAGLWEFPGGKVEPNETALAALRREVAEELTLDVAEADLAFLAEAAEPNPGIAIRLYACRVWRGEPVCHAAQELGWFAGEAMLALPMPPLDVHLAQAVLATLDLRN